LKLVIHGPVFVIAASGKLLAAALAAWPGASLSGALAVALLTVGAELIDQSAIASIAPRLASGRHKTLAGAAAA
jgi:hypothetical protein